jgi:hypothetical protein
MSKSLGVTRPLGERLRSLLRNSYPRGNRYALEPGASLTGMTLDEARDFSDYIRQVRAGRYQRPPPERAWTLGAAVGVLAGKRWINPVTGLFACGHYGLVAGLFVDLGARIESRSFLGELARALRTVVSETIGPRYAGVSDELAVQEAKNWDSSFQEAERYDRRVWSLDGPQYALFAQSWRRLTQLRCHHPELTSSNAAVAGCQLIADAAEYPVADRDRFASLIITDAISA